MTRFYDEGKCDADFQREIAVRCPKCDEQALVVADDYPWRASRVHVSCASCGYNEKWRRGKWKGPVVGHVRRRCGYCGRWLEKKFLGPRHPYETLLKCPGCGLEMVEPIQWHQAPEPGPHDPYFGYVLWFVGAVRGNAFWVYNREHLAFLKAFVSARIRVREPNRNSSLASRLPSWLLARKNRGAVLREIRRMEKQFNS